MLLSHGCNLGINELIKKYSNLKDIGIVTECDFALKK